MSRHFLKIFRVMKVMKSKVYQERASVASLRFTLSYLIFRCLRISSTYPGESVGWLVIYWFLLCLWTLTTCLLILLPSIIVLLCPKELHCRKPASLHHHLMVFKDGVICVINCFVKRFCKTTSCGDMKGMNSHLSKISRSYFIPPWV